MTAPAPGGHGARTAVIVPAYQVEGFVAAALASVQAQTVGDWECVVVDDGSRDGTAGVVAEIAATDPRVRLVRQANAGVSGARNTGLAHVSPDVRYLAFLDPDDLWCPDALEHLIAALERAPVAVGAYGYAELVDERGEPLAPGLHPARQRDRRRLRGRRLTGVPELEPLRFEEWVVVGPVWPPAVALHRREVVDAVGFFDTGLVQQEDWDLYTRMSRLGDFQPIGRQVAWYRQHPGQVTKRSTENVVNLDAVRRKTWGSPLNTAEQRRTATRAWRQLQWRRTARCGQRLFSAVRRRQWADARDLARGTAVLARQNLLGGPPVARRQHVKWARRTV